MPAADIAEDLVTTQFERLVEGLMADAALLEKRGWGRWASIPGSRQTIEDLERISSLTTSTFIQLLKAGRPPTESDLEDRRARGRLMAEQGVSLVDMMQIARIMVELITERAHELALRDGFCDAALLRLLELTNAWIDRSNRALVAGHREVELAIQVQAEQDRTKLVRRMLAGDLTSSDWNIVLESHDLREAKPLYAVRAHVPAPANGITISHYLARRGKSGILALVDSEVCGLLARLPPGPSPTAIGFGVANDASQVRLAFAKAKRALQTALATGSTGMFDLDSLGVQPAIVADDDVGEALHKRYIEPVDRATRAGSDILDTVQAYLEANCRLDVTAAQRWVHLNTVRYRLARFEELTKSSLHDTNTLLEVWWALRRRQLAADSSGGPFGREAQTGLPSMP